MGNSTTREHMPQLDSLRGLACLAVIFSHFAPDNLLVQRMLPWGAMGVHLFFVLSGFLITRILLDARDRAATHSTPRRELRQFYIRRLLRIFPLYYAVLVVLYVIDFGLMRETMVIHLFYVQNLWRCIENVHFINHLWTLAVEEQFYLLWPWVVLLVPSRYLPRAIAAMMATAMLSRFTAWSLDASYLYLNIFTLSNLDTLGAGALLAWRWKRHPTSPLSARLVCGMIALSAVLLAIIATLNLSQPGVLKTVLLLLGSSSCLMFVPLVDAAARGFQGIPGRLLNFTPLRYLGKISYGLYVLHPFVELAYNEAATFLPLPQAWMVQFVLMTALSMLLAALSWHLFEYPINRLKRYFPYAL